MISSYQWLNRRAVIATDLYNDFAARSDPGLNVVIRQPLPFGGLLPGKLEATADFRNLLKAGYVSDPNLRWTTDVPASSNSELSWRFELHLLTLWPVSGSRGKLSQ